MMKFSTLVHQLGAAASDHSLSSQSCKTQGDWLDPEIVGVAPLDEAIPGTLSFVEISRAAAIIQTQASALILPIAESLQAQATAQRIAWIATPQPRLLFAQAIALFYQPFQPTAAIHPTAVIDPSVQLGNSVSIGAYVTIQAGVKLGDQVCIHPQVVIYPQAQIGDRTVLHAGCVIHERTSIGAQCVIHSGAVIGAEGFGFVPTREGWFKMQQSGYTVLEDNVEIGCNSNIDRPAMGTTRIGWGTKVDNLVQIGHGCQIGRNCVIAAHGGLAGGVKLGNHVVLAGQVGISNQVKLGDQVTVSAKAGVISDVEAGTTVSGYPAIP
ncbi:MAG TPA: UDP-3-O-(3-hydroxymyristoyl)glucosamine N-acyltransferase, partial [Candidatus Caenarcaniphilales bacterium]